MLQQIGLDMIEPTPFWWTRSEGTPKELLDWPSTEGVLRVIEHAKNIPFPKPFLVRDLSSRNINLSLPADCHLHGSVLVRRHNSLLFGPSHLVNQEFWWSCESQAEKQQYLEFMLAPFYSAIWGGVRPGIRIESSRTYIDLEPVKDAITVINEPVFLATPAEPSNWGRWVTTVIPRVNQFREFRSHRKLLCCIRSRWQRDFLRHLGVGDAEIIAHDPGKTYLLKDVLTVEYDISNLTVSLSERAIHLGVARRAAESFQGLKIPKLFVSRQSQSIKHPRYRVLQNEAELLEAVERRGFVVCEPELLPIRDQIALFSNAQTIVALGGAGLFNAAFCGPTATVVSIESSGFFALPHSRLIGSMGHRYGVIFGEQDQDDTTPIHKRWSINVSAVEEILESFC
jgi:hypothetical protein